MARVEKSIEINAPPETVFSLIRWDKVPEYYDSIKKVEWTSEPKMKAWASITRVIAAITSSRMVANCAFRSRKGMSC